MPGNEVGDRVHNFLGQESLQQGQHNSQVIDGTWPGLNNNSWVGSQRQVGGSLVSNFKNYSAQQLALAESERGHVAQSLSLQHGFNFMQPALRPDISRTQSQTQSAVANGYMQGHQAFHTRQNEANFLGMDTASRGISILDSHIANNSDFVRTNSLRLESAESPVNYDFFGSPQLMGVQHPGILHSLPRQQSGIADMQLLQQHVMLKQMQEFQRQQLKPEFQQHETMHIGSINQASSISKQGSPNLSQVPINGIPIHDASNHSWQPELMTANPNWMQHVASSGIQVASSGLVSSPDPGQARLMGFAPQQVSQSLYGVPLNSSRGNPSNSVENDKSTVQPMATSTSFLSSNQYATFANQVSLPGGNSLSRQSEHGKNMFGTAAAQGLNSGANSENLQLVNTQSRNLLMQESYGRQEPAGQRETSQEKSVVKANPSQNVAALDPTEEKILFGSDDSVWDIFGRGSNMGAMLDGGDSLGTFPSVQSGSWSALMQSAVAETSSSDIGLQEQWNGLSLDNGESLTRNKLSSVAEDGYRKQTTWVDNSLPASSQLVPSSNDTNMNLNHCSVAGIQQTGVPTSHEENLRQHDDTAKMDVGQTPDRHYNLLNNSNLQNSGGGSSRHLENSSHSPDIQLDARSISGQMQCTAFGSGSQPYKDANGWNFINPPSHDRNSVLNDNASESSSQFPGVGNHINQMQQIGRGSGFWKPESLPDARMPFGNFQSVMKSQVSNEGANLNNDATAMDSMSVRTKLGTQELQKSRNLDLWRDADFPKRSGAGDTLEKERKNHDKVPQMVDSLASNHQVNVTNDSWEVANSNMKENSNDSFRSNVSLNDAGGIGENELLDGNDRRGVKSKASGQSTKKPSVTRKFQYHPMGDLDVDVGAPYNAKHVMHSQSMQQHVSQGLEGYDHKAFGQSKFHGGFGGSKQIEKDCVPGFQGDLKFSEQSKKKKPDHASPVSTPMSRNMLELLQNVDQSSHPRHSTHFSSSGQQNQPGSQGFNLQLAPPSEKIAISDCVQSQSMSRPGNSVNLKNVDSEIGKKGHAWFGEFKNNDKDLHQNNEADISGSFSSRAPYQGSNIREQHVSSLNGQVIQSESSSASGRFASDMKQSDGSCEIVQTNQSRKLPALHFSGAPNNDHADKSQLGFVQQSHGGVAGQEFPVLEAMTASQASIPPISSQQVAFSKMLHSAWTNNSALQNLSGVLHPTDSKNIFKTPSQLKADELNAPTTSALSEKAQGTARDMQPATLKQVSPENDVGHSTLSASQVLCRGSDQATTQRDIEAFGRSLRPNNSINQNYSLLHQVQAMRAGEVDHQNNRSTKRFKGAEVGLEAQHAALQGRQQSSFGSNAVVRDAMPSQTSASSGNCKLVLPSSNSGDGHDSHASFQEKSTFVGNNAANLSGSNFTSEIRVEHPQISPQMAPWFDQYGTSKNGLMFPSENTQKTSDLKSAEKPLMVVRPSDSLQAHNSVEHINAAGETAKLGNLQQISSPVSIASEHISSPHLGSSIIDQNLSLRPKKRKGPIPGLLPWHKEVTVGLQRLQTISAAEVDWARAANRLTEKVEDQAEYAEDRLPVLRSKRRVVLTTQLMQQLFQAPSRVFSANVREHCEGVAYFTARLALGDACSSVTTCARDDVGLPESGNMSCEKVKSTVRIGDEYIAKAMEDYISRTKILETELLRLDKRPSILDLRLECQELDKFSIINRFAKFHGRGQGDGNGAEALSSSDTGVGGHKSFAQRHVAAISMPKNIPDRVQCLSL